MNCYMSLTWRTDNEIDLRSRWYTIQRGWWRSTGQRRFSSNRDNRRQLEIQTHWEPPLSILRISYHAFLTAHYVQTVEKHLLSRVANGTEGGLKHSQMGGRFGKRRVNYSREKCGDMSRGPQGEWQLEGAHPVLKAHSPLLGQSQVPFNRSSFLGPILHIKRCLATPLAFTCR